MNKYLLKEGEKIKIDTSLGLNVFMTLSSLGCTVLDTSRIRKKLNSKVFQEIEVPSLSLRSLEMVEEIKNITKHAV